MISATYMIQIDANTVQVDNEMQVYTSMLNA
jgi:hypothetical protein